MSGIKRYRLSTSGLVPDPKGNLVEFKDIMPIVQEAFRNGKRAKEFELTQTYGVPIEPISS
jgi:hypothetical protein